MKQLSFSSSLAIALAAGLVVAGVVMAFTGPSGAPPTNNVDTPLNVSNNTQVKGGPLIVNGNLTTQVGLQALGYIQISNWAGPPAASDCDDPLEEGRLAVYSNGATDRLYVCADNGWGYVNLSF